MHRGFHSNIYGKGDTTLMCMFAHRKHIFIRWDVWRYEDLRFLISDQFIVRLGILQLWLLMNYPNSYNSGGAWVGVSCHSADSWGCNRKLGFKSNRAGMLRHSQNNKTKNQPTTFGATQAPVTAPLTPHSLNKYVSPLHPTPPRRAAEVCNSLALSL